jgi:probable HAF family extracellular repeat protein
MALVPALGLGAPAGAATTPRYTIRDLGALGSGISQAAGINNLGVAVGTAVPDGGNTHAVRWNAAGGITDLGSLGGSLGSGANAINDAGEVVGYSARPGGTYVYPVRWSPSGAITDVSLPGINRLGELRAINPAGRAAGGQRPASSAGNPVGILYNVDGTTTDLLWSGGSGTSTTAPTAPVAPTTSPSGGNTLFIANGINARNQVVGGGYLWQNGAATALPSLRSESYSYGVGNAINVAGVVAGYAGSPDGTTHAATWRGTTITDLGGMSGYNLTTAKAINAAGQVVGNADPQCSPCATVQAWVWEPGGTITPLENLIPAGSGWSLRDATGINDRGQIVGTGLHNGVQHAFVLTPTTQFSINFQPAGVPTPAGYTADTGAVYGNRGDGLSFGWNLDNAANTRDRDASDSPDQRYDTFAHLQKPGTPRTWELAVPNGTYLVHAVSGDPCCTDSTFRLTVEGILAVSGSPSSTSHWFESTVRVTVTDGRLSIGNGAGSSNNKINYLDVVRV